MADRPAPEFALDVELVRLLLQRQFPDLSDLSISLLARGWDNTTFRLGDDLIVRLPHREASAALVLNEQACLAKISERVDLSIPVPIHVGVPDAGFPWSWSITPWFEGEVAALVELAHPADTAEQLGRFCAQVHAPAPSDAPTNPYRGIPLRGRAAMFADHLDALQTDFDKAKVAAVFEAALEAPLATDRLWLHGDLHTRNIIVNDGDLAAIIDWGDVCAGDGATDLAAAYMLVPDHVDSVQRAAQATDADMARARGWAIHFAIVYQLHGDDDPVMGGISDRLFRAPLE